MMSLREFKLQEEDFEPEEEEDFKPEESEEEEEEE